MNKINAGFGNIPGGVLAVRRSLYNGDGVHSGADRERGAAGAQRRGAGGAPLCAVRPAHAVALTAQRPSDQSHIPN